MAVTDGLKGADGRSAARLVYMLSAVGVREEQVPAIGWESSIDPSQVGKEVCLKHMDGPFSSVAVVYVRWHQLVFAFPGGGDGFFVGVAGIVVKDVHRDSQSPCLQVSHQFVVSWYAVTVMARGEGFYQNGIGIEVVCDHNVLVATAGTDWEAADAICEQFIKRDFQEVE
jgi:hypothetical protein